VELQSIIRELHNLKTEQLPEIELKIEPEYEDIEEAKQLELITDHLILQPMSLNEKLAEFNNEIIRKKLPDTPDSQRLLRPAMLEAFLEYLPTNKSEFLERMPYYLRKPTHPDEGMLLESILEIINLALEKEN